MDLAHEVEQKNRTGHEAAEAVTATREGFAMAGSTNSRRPGTYQAWVLDFDGTASRPRWERTHDGGLGSYGRALSPLPGGGLVVAGEVEVARDQFQPWVLALNRDGSPRWERTPGTGGFNGLTSVGVLDNGTIVAGGVQGGAGWLLWLSPDGQPLGETRLEKLERVTSLAVLPGGRLAVAGTAESSTTGLGTSAVLVFEADRQPAWAWWLPAERRGELAALAAMPDGGLVATGRTRAPGAPDWGLWVVRLDAKGRIQWEHLPEDATVEAGHAVTALPDGGAAVAGDVLKGLADRDARVWCLGPDGTVRWRKSYGGGLQDLARGITRLADGGLIVAGSTMSRGAGKTDLWVFRVSADGDLTWQETFGTP